MSQKGYYRLPEIYENTIYFVCDEDIWSHKLGDQTPAKRLTTGDGICIKPKISPNGKVLAYVSTISGESNVYTMAPDGGQSQRITHFKFTDLLGWKDDKTILVGSTHEHFTNRERLLYEVNIENFTYVQVPLGPVSAITTSPSGASAIGRHTGDPARWKRYRGGTAGTLWVKENKKSKYRQVLKNLPTNLANPCFIDERLFFISDHEGFGNIYSVNKRGTGIKRHTHHDNYYIRSFSYHDGRIVYVSGAELFVLDLEEDTDTLVDVSVNSQFLDAQERFVDAEDYLQDFDMTRDAQELLINSRGKVFFMPPWSGGPIRLGDDTARYKVPKIVWNDESEAVAAIKLDDENEEHLVVFDLDNYKEKELVVDQKWGKVMETCSNPEQPTLALANNRNELFLVNIEKNKVEKIDVSKNDHINELKWSPDGRFLCYRKRENVNDFIIKVYDTKSKTHHRVVKNVLMDFSATFSGDSKTLFFIGSREFNPTSADLLYQISFPFLTKVYALPLTESETSPMRKFLNFEVESDEDEEEKKKADLKIDWDTLENRIEALPFGQGGFRDLFTYKDTLYIVKASVGPNDPNSTRWENSKYTLMSYSFKEKKMKTVVKNIDPTTLKVKGKYVLLTIEGELRVLNLESKPTEGEDYNKKDGWIDLSRIKIKHCPMAEWKQMYREAWILQREHFWTSDMSKIDWVHVYKKYLPQLDKVRTRSDFSDLIWEMQGELGTSHAYEFGGDYPNLPNHEPVGSLDAKFEYHSRTKSFEIKEIFKGDSWLKGHDSPLTNAGVSLKVGDHIYAVDGETFTHANSLSVLLENKASTEIDLLVKRLNKKVKEHVSLRANAHSNHTLYRQWVNQNREYVKKKSRGRLGYVHIPDMSYKGFSEFWRAYATEHECDGLVVDVRYNGGGNVSQLLLKELQQKVIAFNQSRWFGESHYPIHSVNGPLVCLTNQHAGSDGDIFSHCFKLLNLGKLIGKRTWGGVIGIWPRHFLNDYSLTSQPEFSFWFKDVGYDVENYGTDPDIEIDITPEDWGKCNDPQLDKGIEVVLKELKTRPPLRPNLAKKPNLKAPKLPKL
jgi:tricorn protease